ncbi:alpha-1,2-fucosyltransferase [Polynucleobacter sp. AP-RePozz3-80-G7]|nr:alpha-1,2-fucosyltransferase [Polynucleobacter sp. AP-RePozz3-80-G7]
MVISKIIGGLGNQMFQYAAGRAISIGLGEPFKVDIMAFNKYKIHQGYELGKIFLVNVAEANKSDISNVLGWRHPQYLRNILSKKVMVNFRPPGLIVEPHFHYSSKILDVPSSCYLKGYWQSENYFSEVSEQIRKDFEFRGSLDGPNYKLVEAMNKTISVSIHIRRGDYLSNSKASETHTLCSLDYYKSAIGYISERVSNPYFYIFSDDIDWAKSNLNIDFPHQYVEHNQGSNSYNDMRLMSMCKHNIIANSSFSWWGGWLNSHMNKIVIAPQNWFSNNFDTRDLLPNSWIRL